MTSRESWTRFWRGTTLLFLCACSCSSHVDRPRGDVEDRLLRIGDAYLVASRRLGRAPNNFDEIKSDVAGEVPDDFLTSPRDGQPLVILWGVDFASLPPVAGSDPFTVAGYEQTGKEGSRYVLRFPRSMLLMTDEEFRKANFPTGHKRPG